jgi:hypothetical protein
MPATNDARMGSSDLFQRAIWIYQHGFVILVTVAAVIQIPLAIVGFIVGNRVADAFGPLRALTESSTPAEIQSAFQQAFSQANPSTGTYGLISFLAGLLLSPALIVTTARLHSGSEATVGESYGRALGAAVRILIGSVVQGLALVGVFLAILVVGIVLAFALQDSPGLVVLAILLSVVLAIVAVIYLLLRWAVWTPAVVLEDLGPLEGLRRSSNLMKGNMLRSFAILFVTALVTAVAGAVLGAIAGAFAGAISAGAGTFVADILAVLTVSWFPIVLTLLFLDLRARQGTA